MLYLYRWRGDLELGERGFAVGLHLSGATAVRLSAVHLRGALGLGCLLAVHGPHVGRGLLQHGAGLGHERGREGLGRVLARGEGVHARRRVPAGLTLTVTVSRRLAVTVLAVVLGAHRAGMARRAYGRALGRAGRVSLGLVRAVLAGFLAAATTVVFLVSLAAAAAAATASGSTLAALEPRALLQLGGRRGGAGRGDYRSPFAALAATSAAAATSSTLLAI